jgi:hypothetical protein
MDGKPDRLWLLNGAGVDIEFDTVTLEQHASELAVTDNPVETGVVISDHAYRQPLQLVIEGAVGDMRLRNDAADRFAGDNLGRAARCWAVMSDLQDAKTIFDVQTGLKLYRSMILVSLSADQNKNSATVLWFRAQLREVIRSQTQTIKYPPRKVGKPKHQASPPKSQGEKKTDEPDPKAEHAKRVSILKSMLAGDDTDAGTKAFLNKLAPTL